MLFRTATPPHGSHAPGALAFGSVTIFNGNFIKGAEVSFDVSPCKSVTGCEESSLFP